MKLIRAKTIVKSDRSHVVLCAKELSRFLVFLRPLASDLQGRSTARPSSSSGSRSPAACGEVGS